MGIAFLVKCGNNNIGKIENDNINSKNNLFY